MGIYTQYTLFTTALEIQVAQGGKCTLRMAGILKKKQVLKGKAWRALARRSKEPRLSVD